MRVNGGNTLPQLPRLPRLPRVWVRAPRAAPVVAGVPTVPIGCPHQTSPRDPGRGWLTAVGTMPRRRGAAARREVAVAIAVAAALAGEDPQPSPLGRFPQR